MIFGAIFGVFRVVRAVTATAKIIGRAMRALGHELNELRAKMTQSANEFRSGKHNIRMHGTVKTTWRGGVIRAQMENAIAQAMTATVADAATMAQNIVPVGETGNLKGSITFEPATKTGNGWTASFGSYSGADYAIYVELGTRFARAQPFVRPSADRIFPSLPSRIKANMG